MSPLHVDATGRHFVRQDGSLFFYLADTAWELTHKCTREQILRYLTVRGQQGFNAVQVAALPEKDGLRRPNAYGELPLADMDPLKPREAYFQHLDFLLEEAGKRDMLVALLPTWGDKWNQKTGSGPEIFTERTAYFYGRWIAGRYRERENLIWVLGGDRPVDTKEQEAVMDAMGRGLREGDGGSHLMTFHPCGAATSLDFLKGKDYLDFHTSQSGHGLECYDSMEYLRALRDGEHKPFMDMECRYEKQEACFNASYGYRWDSHDVRRNAYWNLCMGVCGHTYGHDSIWQLLPGWEQALEDPGAWEAQYVKRLALSRDYIGFREAPELLLRESMGLDAMAAGRGANYAYWYTPQGSPIFADLKTLGSVLKMSWYNPRSGEERPFAIVGGGENVFVPASSGKNGDWILIADVLS